MQENQSSNKKETKEFSLKPYTIRELAQFYSVSTSTMQRWLKKSNIELGQRIGYYLTVKQVGIIIEHLGLPKQISLE